MDKIQIKCTSCGQKFAVTESYIGRMVECGACDEKFKVEGAAIVRQKKHYPGEKSESNAATFAKSPNTTTAPQQEQDVSFQTASYQNVSAEYAQPQKPIKTLMLIIGALVILSFIAIFLLGGREGGILKGLDNTKRLVLAGFIAVAGTGLILAGTRNKVKGLLLSLILGGSLLAMPFVFPEVLESTITTNAFDDTSLSDSKDSDTEIDETSFSARLDDYKNSIGFDKVEASRVALDDPDSLKAIVLRDCKIQYLDTILPYLQYTVGFQSPPVTYTFGRELNGQPITLVTFVTDTPLERVFEVTQKFGTPQEMNDVRSALKVIEIVVDTNTLVGQPTERTSDPSNQHYFDSNYLELISIDRSKQLDAAKRLQTATRKGRQSDISRALVDLINTNDHELSRQAITTLHQWTLPEYNTDQAVLEYAREVAGTDEMTRPVMDYLTDLNVAGSEEVFAKQWASPKGYLLWENYLIRAKDRGEQAVISVLPTVSKTHYKSAASILSQVGTAKSIPTINALLPKTNEEDKKYFKAVIDEIKSRQ
ncbi:MAG: hypothetical protein ACSHX6_07565 [Akkermansiaceae bacterium]